MIIRPKYVHKFKDRHGRVRYYLRRRGHPVVALPDAADAPAFLAAYNAAMLATTAEPQSRALPGSLDALVRSYYRSADFRQLGPSTRAVYERLIEALCRKHGTKPIAALNHAGVRKIISERADTPAAANHILRTLRALLRHAVEEGWRGDDPTQGVRRLKEKGEGAETWTESDIATYEGRWPAGTRQRLALALLLYTGQRRSDVVRMGREHVKGNALAVRQVKTGARLLIPLHSELASLLAAGSDQPTFLMTELGKTFTPNGFYMRFRGWCETAGLPAGRSPHGLRKAAARRLAEAGCSAHEIASITGHKTLAEVQRYTVAADQEQLAERAMARIRPGVVANPSG